MVSEGCVGGQTNGNTGLGHVIIGGLLLITTSMPADGFSSFPFGRLCIRIGHCV